MMRSHCIIWCRRWRDSGSGMAVRQTGRRSSGYSKKRMNEGKATTSVFVNWQMPGGFGKKLVREMREIFDRDTLKNRHIFLWYRGLWGRDARGGCRLYPEKTGVASLRYTVWSQRSAVCRRQRKIKRRTMIFPESVHCWRRIMQLMQRSFRDFWSCSCRSGMCR